MIASVSNGGTVAVKAVYLDDVKMLLVVEADDEAGTVTSYVKDERGYFVNKDGHTVKETKSGVVRIELNPGWRYDTVHKRFVYLTRTPV